MCKHWEEVSYDKTTDLRTYGSEAFPNYAFTIFTVCSISPLLCRKFGLLVWCYKSKFLANCVKTSEAHYLKLKFLVYQPSEDGFHMLTMYYTITDVLEYNLDIST